MRKRESGKRLGDIRSLFRVRVCNGLDIDRLPALVDALEKEMLPVWNEIKDV